MGFSSDRRTVGRAWGKAPVRIEPVSGRVTLPPGEWACFALGLDGAEKGKAEVEEGPGGAPMLALEPGGGTMWWVGRRK